MTSSINVRTHVLAIFYSNPQPTPPKPAPQHSLPPSIRPPLSKEVQNTAIGVLTQIAQLTRSRSFEKATKFIALAMPSMGQKYHLILLQMLRNVLFLEMNRNPNDKPLQTKLKQTIEEIDLLIQLYRPLSPANPPPFFASRPNEVKPVERFLVKTESELIAEILGSKKHSS